MFSSMSSQMVIKRVVPSFRNHVPLQKTFLRTYPTTHKNAHKWRRPKDRVLPVDPKHFPIGVPVSGSFSPNEDLVETNNRPYELNVSQLTKKGYLRFQSPYDPPEDAENTLLSIAKSLNPALKDVREIVTYKLDDIKFKYNFLTKAVENLNHRVPNSLLHLMETIGDVVQFYKTPVEVSTPYEEILRSKDLPPNLHVQKEPIRFHPETDTAFGGITAYPKTTTVITGLRAKQKFKGQQFKVPWPHA